MKQLVAYCTPLQLVTLSTLEKQYQSPSTYLLDTLNKHAGYAFANDLLLLLQVHNVSMEPLDEPFRFSDVVDYFHSTELPQALTISATLLLLLVILPTIVGTILNRIENYKLGERIPGPDSKGRWGRKSHKKAFMAGGGSVGDPTPFLSALHHEYGLLARFWIGKVIALALCLHHQQSAVTAFFIYSIDLQLIVTVVI